MSSSDRGKKTKKAPPSYNGMDDFVDVDTSAMDAGDGTTRRAGGGISFEPMIAGFPGGISFGSPNPYDSSMKQTTLTKQPPSVSKPVTKHEPAVVNPFVWKLRDVPTLPELHPLERTAVFVEGSTPSEITERISNILRERSIEAEYENEKAKAKCTTPEGVECRVRLYRGRGKYSHGIIVEVQRRFGSSTNFQTHVSAILNAAEGLAPPPPPPALGHSADALPLVSDSEEDYSPPSGASSLKMVEKMFGHGGYDSQYLALQTLWSLTDLKKMEPATAKSVSIELLSSSNAVGDKLYDLLCKKDEDEGFKLRPTAFSVLANAVEATKGNIDQAVHEFLRPVLLKELGNAESNPRAAQMAARCFEFLYKGDHDQGEIAAALEKAQAVGAARHAGLHQQAQRCLDKMLF